MSDQIKQCNLLSLLLLLSVTCFSQNKQANTLFAELYADAPYMTPIIDSLGNPEGIPIFFVCHDADGIGSAVDLISINVQVKCMSDTDFNTTILFDTISIQEFQENIIQMSVADPDLNIQQFDTSAILKHNQFTFKFHDEMNLWVPPVYFEEIKQTWWYFVYEFPAYTFQHLCDTLDFKITFKQDWSTDDIIYLRVIRTENSLPSVNGWFRGDTHLHSMFTQNTAEIGFPAETMALMAKKVGLDWFILTDHSCDFDNYGASVHQNWQELGNVVEQNNLSDSMFKMIRGIELSVNNSAGQTVHALIYPDPTDPFSLPYIGDGHGDVTSTSINIQMMSDSLVKYDAFCFAAHPFAQGDKLSSIINGSVWNISHPEFKLNGINFDNCGEVICNDTSLISDIFSGNNNSFFISNLIGGQLLNLRNRMQVSNELNNPWDPYQNHSDMFEILDSLSLQHYLCRYWQNKEVYLFILRNALFNAWTSGNYNEVKFFQIAGTDAHGSFNYSNTDLSMGLIGAVSDNALGKLSTLVYCPDGMGNNGENILDALKHGRAVLSEGPIVTLKIRHSITQEEFVIGDDITIPLSDLNHWQIIYENATSPIFGPVQWLRLLIGTRDTIAYYYTGLMTQEMSLATLMSNVFGASGTEKEMFIIAEMKTHKNDSPHWDNNDPLAGDFYSYTNPIWIFVKNDTYLHGNQTHERIELYPNPATDVVLIDAGLQIQLQGITDITGKNVTTDYSYVRKNLISINIEMLEQGCYFVILLTKQGETITKKFIKY